MQTVRLQNDIDSIQRRIAGVNVKLISEMKVRTVGSLLHSCILNAYKILLHLILLRRMDCASFFVFTTLSSRGSKASSASLFLSAQRKRLKLQ